MKKHMEDYEDFDLVDMEDFIKYFDLIKDFLFVLNHIEKEETDTRLDMLIEDLQKLRNKKNRHICRIDLDNLIDNLIEEECYAYDNFNDVLNELENGTIPNKQEMLDDYIKEKLNELGGK